MTSPSPSVEQLGSPTTPNADACGTGSAPRSPPVRLRPGHHLALADGSRLRGAAPHTLARHGGNRRGDGERWAAARLVRFSRSRSSRHTLSRPREVIRVILTTFGLTTLGLSGLTPAVLLLGLLAVIGDPTKTRAGHASTRKHSGDEAVEVCGLPGVLQTVVRNGNQPHAQRHRRIPTAIDDAVEVGGRECFEKPAGALVDHIEILE